MFARQNERRRVRHLQISPSPPFPSAAFGLQRESGRNSPIEMGPMKVCDCFFFLSKSSLSNWHLLFGSFTAVQ